MGLGLRRQAQQKRGEQQNFVKNRAGRPDFLQNPAVNHRLAGR